MRIKYHPDGTVTLIPANERDMRIVGNGECECALIDPQGYYATFRTLENLSAQHGENFRFGGIVFALDRDENGKEVNSLYILWRMNGEKELTYTKVEV